MVTLIGENDDGSSEKAIAVATARLRLEGRLVGISASMLYRICKTLDVQPGYFFEGYEETDSGKGGKRVKPFVAD